MTLVFVPKMLNLRNLQTSNTSAEICIIISLTTTGKVQKACKEKRSEVQLMDKKALHLPSHSITFRYIPDKKNKITQKQAQLKRDIL